MSRPVVSRYVPQVPDGWVKCPRFGDPRFFEGLNIIPCKVPLSRRFDQQVGPSGRWTLADAIKQFRGYGMEVATVIDLTKSRNYYDFGLEMEELGCPPISYFKIECRGRGEAPQPSEVNEAVWHIFTHLSDPLCRDKYILLHCTHGFNRTGYVIVSALVRLCRDRGMSVRRALQRFAESRPPGIYKDHYINDLCKYYHETRDPRIITPRVPAWKGNDDAEDAADAANEEAGAEGEGEQAAPSRPEVHHEDIWSIGERVCAAEAEFVQRQVCLVLPFDGGRGGHPHHPQQLRFPGMQPVSLSLDRMRDLVDRRYHVTWKADGTRYMVFILPQGTYVMDRSFNVVRCEMRFPCGTRRPPAGQRAMYPVGKPHACTLLDGEMVLDVDPEGRQPPRLRYLIYDVVMINSTPLLEKPWKERYRAIPTDITNPRDAERKYIENWRHRPFDPARAEYGTPPLSYDYSAEPFSVRQKPFWPVWQIEKVFERFHDPHKVGHESDGLILQGYEDAYVAGTCEQLYKWKFAHMNSVDFLLQCATVPAAGGGAEGGRVLDPSSPEPLQLLLLDQAKSRGGRRAFVPLKNVDREGHYRVEFPPDVDPLTYEGRLVECTFDRGRGVWLFMRERKDKDTPNGDRVYHRIKESIINHVDQELLVGTLKQALLAQPCYANDRALLTPQQLEQLRREVEAWQRNMREREEQEAAAKLAAERANRGRGGGGGASGGRGAVHDEHDGGGSPGGGGGGFDDFDGYDEAGAGGGGAYGGGTYRVSNAVHSGDGDEE
ncbi:hypothetical protein Agub_g11382, partial [Astrephomene gubernaculifera]